GFLQPVAEDIVLVRLLDQIAGAGQQVTGGRVDGRLGGEDLVVGVVVAVVPALAERAVDLGDQVAFVVVGVVPGAIAEQAIARADHVAAAAAVAGGVVLEALAAGAGQLAGGVVAVGGRLAVVGLGGQLTGGVTAVGVVGQHVAGAVLVLQVGQAA